MKGAMKIIPYLIAGAELMSCAPGIQMGNRSLFKGTQELAIVEDKHGNEGCVARIGSTPYGVASYVRIAALAETDAKAGASEVEQILREKGLGVEALAEVDRDNNFRLDPEEFMAFLNAYRP
ncbi:MAG: hypothetical protein ABH879_03065 [archaeon]